MWLVAASNQVFEADFEEGLWSEVRTLGNDQALFLGRGCSRAIHVSPYDLSRDCLFFLDDYTDWIWKKTTTSCGVYDMKDEKVYSPLPMVSWKSGDQAGGRGLRPAANPQSLSLIFCAGLRLPTRFNMRATSSSRASWHKL